jgi:hypothetical protein
MKKNYQKWLDDCRNPRCERRNAEARRKETLGRCRRRRRDLVCDGVVHELLALRINFHPRRHSYAIVQSRAHVAADWLGAHRLQEREAGLHGGVQA